MGSTWREAPSEDDDTDRWRAAWLASARSPGEATPFGSPPVRRGVLRRVLGLLLGPR